MMAACAGRTFLPIIVCVGLGAWLSPVQAADAADRVRVALADTADRVTVSSVDGLRLDLPAGRREHVSSDITIVRSGEVLHVQDTRMQGRRITLRGRNGVLHVTTHVKDMTPRRWTLNGHVDVAVARDAQMLVVNVVGLESYVAGVVGAEMNPSWHDEALNTQAVAARTYVVHKTIANAARPFDVRAGVQDQVYTGRANVNDAVRHAVNRTRGEVVTHNGRPIFAVYSSTSAGPTEDVMNVWSENIPYLKGVACPFDRHSPRYQWRTTVPFDVIETRLREEGYPIGALATLAPASLTNAGRVNDMRILHSGGAFMVEGQTFRRILGYDTLFSTKFHIERIGKDVVFAGNGAGHAVGLCQWGAKEMAERGYHYRTILHYYYPGTEIRTLGHVIMRLPS